MKVFISWSGSRSHLAAEALRNWLPSVLQALEPWLSSADIDAGSRWHLELGSRLSSSSFGIICLTPENLGSQWLLYEAGALSKSVEASRVVPFLIGLRKSQLAGPLSHFQAVQADKEGVFELLRSLNVTLGASGERALSEAGLAQAYKVWWPEFDGHLGKAREASSGADEKGPRDMEERLLNTLLQVASDYRVVLDKLNALQATRSTAINEENARG